MQQPPDANQPMEPDGSDRPAPPDDPEEADESAPGAVAVRTPTPDDAPRLAAINVDTWRHTYAGIISATYLDALDVGVMTERWRKLLADVPGQEALLVSEIDAEVAGYARGGPYRVQQDAPPDEEPNGWCELYAIYTHPTMQGRGAGTAVHDVMIETLTGRGFSQASLWTPRDNRSSIEWYQRRGWRPDGGTTIWMGTGQPITEIRLVRRLGDTELH